MKSKNKSVKAVKEVAGFVLFFSLSLFLASGCLNSGGSGSGGNGGDEKNPQNNQQQVDTIGMISGTDHQAVPPAQLGLNGGLPETGKVFQDPRFGTKLMRVTSQTDNGSYANHEYSQLQAFSPDNNYMLISEDGDYEILRTSDLSRVEGIDARAWNAPRWQPAFDSTIVSYDTNEDETLRVIYTDAATQQSQTVYTFPDRFDRIRGNQSFDELSEDGRWMAGMATLAGNAGDQAIFVLDMEAVEANPAGETPIVVETSLNGLFDGSTCSEDPDWGVLEPDWIAPSPLGNYLVLQWVRDELTRCSGMELWDIQTGSYVGHVNARHDHGDLGVTADGKEVFVSTINAGEIDGLPAVAYYNFPLPGEGIEVLQANLVKTLPWHAVSHISCRGPHGVCLISSSSPEEGWGYDGLFDGELFLLFMNGSYRRLAHHRSSECGYWVQPRATISLDGSRILFDSDFWVETGGKDSCETVDPDLGGGEVYMIIDPPMEDPNNAGLIPAAD